MSTEVYTTKYIIESGVVELADGFVWSYEKWSDGILKCFGSTTISSDFSTTWGSMYCSAVFPKVSYPFSFRTRPNEQVRISSTKCSLFTSTYGGSNSADSTGSYRAMRATTYTEGNVPITIDYSIVGRFK